MEIDPGWSFFPRGTWPFEPGSVGAATRQVHKAPLHAWEHQIPHAPPAKEKGKGKNKALIACVID